MNETRPMIGDIKRTINTTGTVEPQNRLEIKPPIAGRVEAILVKEGQDVKTGDILALMSSTERAALLDAAKLKGQTEVEYWQDVYKTAPLIAPIDGKVIVRSVEPGQTVTTGDAVLVLSDKLIVKADVDETDIGSVKVGQNAVVQLDAYGDISVNSIVDHIAYESELINNVNIYYVDILPEEVPEVFRAGMSANVDIIVDEKENVLLVPIEAVTTKENMSFVQIKDGTGEISNIPVSLGIQDDEHVEITAGLTKDDIIVTKEQFITVRNKQSGGNPFMPKRPGRNR